MKNKDQRWAIRGIVAASGWAEYGDAALGDATACLPSFDRDCLEVPPTTAATATDTNFSTVA